ncbi:MAG: hypothetical protein Fur0032_10600 [Terrimicrobiaceae bacterium]
MEILGVTTRVARMISVLTYCRNAVLAGLTMATPVGDLLAATFEEVNAAFGVPVFADENLWDDPDKDTADRLKWPQESLTPRDASFRLYAGPSVRVLGARPYSLALYGEGGTVSSLSLVFANKGDVEVLGCQQFGGSQRESQREMKKVIKEFEEQLRADEKSIEAALTAVLGEPKQTSFGQGREMREQVKRWDWNGHAILLAAPDGEYVAVRVIPSDLANGTRKPRISADELRAELATRVERRTNGDVVVTTIPMVDQGPKGFCVPATWERALRYMGIPADMYILAMAGDTGIGGGTYLSSIVNGAKETVTRAGRRLQISSGKISLPTLAPLIDRGLPVMWAMYVDPQLNRELTKRTQERAGVQDPAEWKSLIAPARKAAKDLKPPRANGHVCMIIGYNKETGEVAVSDSWGEEFAERWMTLEEAEAISQRSLMTIQL